MTQDNRIKWNLQQIARAATDKGYFREWGAEEIVHYIQSVLGHIEELLQEPEPKTLAASVFRLTDLCNRLEAENHKLKNDLDAAERKIDTLHGVIEGAHEELDSYQVDRHQVDGFVASVRTRIFWLHLRAERIGDLEAGNRMLHKDIKKLREELALREASLRIMEYSEP